MNNKVKTIKRKAEDIMQMDLYKLIEMSSFDLDLELRNIMSQKGKINKWIQSHTYKDAYDKLILVLMLRDKHPECLYVDDLLRIFVDAFKQKNKTTSRMMKSSRRLTPAEKKDFSVKLSEYQALVVALELKLAEKEEALSR